MEHKLKSEKKEKHDPLETGFKTAVIPGLQDPILKESWKKSNDCWWYIK